MHYFIKFFYFFAFSFFVIVFTNAQDIKNEDIFSTKIADPNIIPPSKRPVDGFYEKKIFKASVPTKYPYIREDDIVFSIRIWRDIDTRLKINKIFSSPKGRLVDFMLEGIELGELTVYDASPTPDDPGGDSFTKLLKRQDVRSKLGGDSVLSPIFNDRGEKIGDKMVYNEFNPDSIVKYRIKEDWYFDKNRSVFESRIIGIAPLVKIKSSSGLTISSNEQPAFWIYFPEFRTILASKIAWVRNDATTLSFDDVFIKRVFDSYIIKKSNTENLSIKDYKKGIDKLYESQLIEEELRSYEHDLWEY